MDIYSLSGFKLGDKYKNLNEILSSKERKNTAELISDSFKSENYLEKILRIEVLNKLKNTSELLEILKGEDETLVNRILKCDWFFEGDNIKKIENLDDLFSSVSFSTRIKILKKLSFCLNDENQAEKIFTSIEKKYGTKIATRLLPACSVAFIKSALTENTVEMSNGQLARIMKKDAELCTFYFMQMAAQKREVFFVKKYDAVLNSLAIKHSDLFLKLFDHFLAEYLPEEPIFRIELKLSYRATKSIIKANANTIVKHAGYFVNILHEKATPRYLNKNFLDFFIKLYPKEIDGYWFSFYNERDIFLKNVSKKCREKILQEAFLQKYGQNLTDYENIHFELVELLSEEDREKVVEKKIKEKLGGYEEVWIPLMGTNKSIPALMKLLENTSDVKKRTALMEYIINSCKINDDRTALTNFCKYYVNKHRNEPLTVQERFFNHLDTKFDISKLEDEQWVHISKLLKIITLNYDAYKSQSLKNTFQKQIKHLYFNKKSFKEYYQTYVKQTNDYALPTIYADTQDLQKQCIYYLSEMISESTVKNKKDATVVLIREIDLWNKYRRRSRLLYSSFPCIEKYITELLNNSENSEYNEVMLYYKKNKQDFVKVSTVILNSDLDETTILQDCLLWCLFYDPKQFMERLPEIVQYALRNNKACQFIKLFKLCRLFTYMEIPQKITDICASKITEPNENTKEKCDALKILSCLSPEQFQSFASPYYPSNSEIDYDAASAHDELKIQISVVQSLRYLNPPSLGYGALKNFCAGDYLKLALPSLHYLSFHSSERTIAPFLEQLLDRPASVKKNAIFLICEVLSKNDIFILLSKLSLTEKNVSIRKVAFKKALNYFLLEGDDAWGLLQTYIDSLDVTDEESLKKLTEFKSLPSKYLSKFLVLAWHTLNKLSKSDKKSKELACSVAEKIDKHVIQLLPDDFVNNMVREYFPTADLIDDSEKTVEFVCLHLTSAKNQHTQNQRFDTILKSVEMFIDAEWNKFDSESCIYKNRFVIGNFIKHLCKAILEEEKIPLQLTEKLVQFWKRVVRPEDGFYIYVYLELVLRLQSSKCNIDAVFVKEVQQLVKNLINTHGMVVIKKISSVLNNVLKYVKVPDISKTNPVFYFAEMLIKSDASTEDYVLIVHSVCSVNWYQKRPPVYIGVIDHLRSLNNPTVKSFLNDYLSKRVFF